MLMTVECCVDALHLFHRVDDELWQVGQLFEPVGGMAFDLLEDLAGFETLYYPALEKRVGSGPKIEVRVELATETFNIE